MRTSVAISALCLAIPTGCAVPPTRGEDGTLFRFTSPGFERQNQPEYGIFFYPEFREVHIYGNLDAQNRATVEVSPTSNELDSGVQVSDELAIEVELLGVNPDTGFADPQRKRFVVIAPQLTAGIAPEPGAATPPGRRVTEIWFHGGTQNDDFDNETDIASRATGSDGNDTLRGGSGRDSLLGGSGNDLLVGRAGDDTLKGDIGSDALFGGSGDDSLRVIATGNDADNNLLCGGRGADTLEGRDIGSATSTLDDGDGEEFADVLSDGTTYQYTAPPDTVSENGTVFEDMDDPGAPFTNTTNC